MRNPKQSSFHLKVALITPVILLLVSIGCGLPFQPVSPEPTLAATEASKGDPTLVPSLPPDEPLVETPLPTQGPIATPAAFPTVPD